MNTDEAWVLGDQVTIWITGVVGTFRAKVVGFKYGAPVLEVLDENGNRDPSWPMRLKPEDYGIRERYQG
jgi:hypothetical protein